jgi:hypothetical protein
VAAVLSGRSMDSTPQYSNKKIACLESLRIFTSFLEYAEEWHLRDNEEVPK